MKYETMEEYLARGGKIIKLPMGASGKKPEVVHSTKHNGPTKILSMEEADLYYGEHKPKKTKKIKSVIDLSALPEELRKKYVDGIKNEESEEDN